MKSLNFKTAFVAAAAVLFISLNGFAQDKMSDKKDTKMNHKKMDKKMDKTSKMKKDTTKM